MKRGLILTILIMFVFATLFYLAYRSHPPAPKGEEHVSLQKYIGLSA